MKFLQPRYRIHDQYPLFEWCSSLMLIIIAVTHLCSPNAVELTSLRRLLANQLITDAVMTALLLVGILRVSAIVANGYSLIWGPILRFAGGIVAVMLWSQLAFELTVYGHVHGYLSFGYVYSIMGVFEILSCWRAASDARISSAKQ